MRRKLYENSYQIEYLKNNLESKEGYIDLLNEEKKRATQEYEEKIRELKSEFLNYISESEEISIETATIGKRNGHLSLDKWSKPMVVITCESSLKNFFLVNLLPVCN